MSTSEYAYLIHWTKMVRTWSDERRMIIYGEVSKGIERPDFTPNPTERRYDVEGVDDLPHAGASLVALKQVLEDFLNETAIR
jgi:hypothetical protein